MPKKYSGRTGQIRNVWGLAKELGLERDNLYGLMEDITGKDSMKLLNTKELNKLIVELGRMKDGSLSGNLANSRQIWKIHELEKQLGWEGEPARLKGYLKKRFRVENIKWLTSQQAWKVIEGMKSMVKREREKHDFKV